MCNAIWRAGRNFFAFKSYASDILRMQRTLMQYDHFDDRPNGDIREIDSLFAISAKQGEWRSI